MKKTTTQKGFTLVELAIVMTIIGLLIGGILKGQELILNARVTATIAQIRAYEAAVTTFRDSFAAMPGDMPNAQTRLPGCGTANFCNPNTAAGGAGNGIVGVTNWDANWSAQGVALSASNPIGNETVLFWIHLLQADLIAGVSSTAISGAAVEWGITHPSARIAGGFIIGYASGANPPPGGTTGVGSTNPVGHVLALVTAPSSALANTGGTQPLTAAKAAQMDRKMDDGRPITGYVQAYGLATSCNTGGLYIENINTNDCGLIFRIQG